jgi:hypothetical protein
MSRCHCCSKVENVERGSDCSFRGYVYFVGTFLFACGEENKDIGGINLYGCNGRTRRVSVRLEAKR